MATSQVLIDTSPAETLPSRVSEEAIYRRFQTRQNSLDSRFIGSLLDLYKSFPSTSLSRQHQREMEQQLQASLEFEQKITLFFDSVLLPHLQTDAKAADKLRIRFIEIASTDPVLLPLVKRAETWTPVVDLPQPPTTREERVPLPLDLIRYLQAQIIQQPSLGCLLYDSAGPLYTEESTLSVYQSAECKSNPSNLIFDIQFESENLVGIVCLHKNTNELIIFIPVSKVLVEARLAESIKTTIKDYVMETFPDTNANLSVELLPLSLPSVDNCALFHLALLNPDATISELKLYLKSKGSSYLDRYYADLVRRLVRPAYVPVVISNERTKRASYSIPVMELYISSIIYRNQERYPVCFYATRGGVLRFFYSDKDNTASIQLPVSLLPAIGACKSRFFVVTFGFREQEGDVGHANALIFDNKARTVFRFEPHGSFKEEEEVAVNQKVDRLIQTEILDKLQVSYTLLTLPNSCPYLPGIQTTQLLASDLPEGGYCVAWSGMFIIAKLQNPDWSNEDLIERLLNGQQEEFHGSLRQRGAMLTEFIQRFIQQIDNTFSLDSKEDPDPSRVEFRAKRRGLLPCSVEANSIDTFYIRQEELVGGKTICGQYFIFQAPPTKVDKTLRLTDLVQLPPSNFNVSSKESLGTLAAPLRVELTKELLDKFGVYTKADVD